MIELTLIMCFTTLFREPANEFCYLVNKPKAFTVQEYCDYRDEASPEYSVTLCHKFNRDNHHDVELLR